MPDHSTPPDPFQEARRESGVLPCVFQGETIPMLLRHAEVREAAKDWQTFSSDVPFRVPIPSEEDLRSVRQLPIETNPPEHTAYRRIVEPFFKRPRQPEFASRVENLVDELLDQALSKDSVEFVHEFAVPLQSRALTYLLNVPESEAETWIAWGIHVFKDSGAGGLRGATLEEYINAQLDRAEAEPGEDFFSALVTATYEGRSLTRAEMAGFANLAFAGGRDTIIHTVTRITAYLAEHPETLVYLREDPKRVVLAGEEFLRVFIPLTHLGRVCPVDTEVHGKTIPAGGRISLCWASANRDESVFNDPDYIQLDRKPNPHLSFGSGAHLCLGAAHARLLIRVLLERLSRRLERITIHSARELVEQEERYDRMVGYESLSATLTAL